MSNNVNLNIFMGFVSFKKLDALNEFVKQKSSITPDELATHIKCKRENAMAILLLLFGLGYADAKLLVYHYPHESIIISNDIGQGFPSLPFVCEKCGDKIEQEIELAYDFLFEIKGDFVFTLEY